MDIRAAVPASIGTIMPDGSLLRASACSSEAILDLRRLAADPGRWFRRFGFDEQLCPFCQSGLPYGTLSFNVGYCQECAARIAWPFNERVAEEAEDELRRDIARELENDDGD